MDIRHYLIDHLLAAAAKAVPEAALTRADITIEKPKNADFGDLSTPLALNLAKKLKQNPSALARKIADAFAWDPAFVQTDPLPPQTVVGGFVNFRLSAAYLHALLREAVEKPTDIGRNQAENPTRMLFEFVSANPTGPMVVVNGRAAAIGDVVARVNEWIGHRVEREYYVNDSGNQVDLLGKSIACRYWQKRGRECEIPEGGYGGAYIFDLAEEIAAEVPGIAGMAQEEMESVFRTKALEKIIASQQAILAQYRVTYTRWFRESSLHASGKVMRMAETLKERGLTYHKDGALWFRSTDFGDDKDWVILRTDGTPTYFLADITYHADKASRGYDESHTFWGPDHHGYIPHLECGVKALGLTTPVFRNHIIQQVNLIRDGQPYKMSKRKGDFVTISDLLDEVGVDAARYFFLMRRLSSHFDFDMDLAVKQGDDNPVFYIQYAHARTCSLVRHAGDQGFTEDDIRAADFGLLTEPETIDVMRKMAEFPNALLQTAAGVEPSRLTTYVETLAAAFHLFYHRHRIVTDDRALSCSRLYLALGVRNLIRTVLDILGVSAPEKM